MPTTERQPILEVKYVRTNILIPLEDNPRTIDEPSFKKLCDSLRANADYLTVRPLLATPDNVVFAGNMRLKAAQHIGMEEVPVAYMDIPEERRRELTIRDNVQNGSWDADALNNAWDAEQLMDWGVDIEELGGVDEGGGSQTAGDDDVPEGGVGTPLTVLGDLYEFKLDRTAIRIMCGDSLNLDAVKTKLLENAEIELVFTVLPWNVNYGSHSNPRCSQNPDRQILNDHMETGDFKQFMADAFSTMAAVSKPGAHAYVCMSAQEWGNLMLTLKDAGWKWSSTIVWAKDRLCLQPPGRDYHTQYEWFWYGWREGAARLSPLVEDRTQTDLWQIPRPSSSDQHPNMKPIELVVRAVKNSSKTGDNVLDLFVGSASTAVACAKTGRNFFGMELDPKHVDRSVLRLHRFLTENSMPFSLKRNGEAIAIESIETANA